MVKSLQEKINEVDKLNDQLINMIIEDHVKRILDKLAKKKQLNKKELFLKNNLIDNDNYHIFK